MLSPPFLVAWSCDTLPHLDWALVSFEERAQLSFVDRTYSHIGPASHPLPPKPLAHPLVFITQLKAQYPVEADGKAQALQDKELAGGPGNSEEEGETQTGSLPAPQAYQSLPGPRQTWCSAQGQRSVASL